MASRGKNKEKSNNVGSLGRESPAKDPGFLKFKELYFELKLSACQANGSIRLHFLTIKTEFRYEELRKSRTFPFHLLSTVFDRFKAGFLPPTAALRQLTSPSEAKLIDERKEVLYVSPGTPAFFL